MDPFIRDWLGAMHPAVDGDSIENAVWRRLGELAASDDEILDACEEYFERCHAEGFGDD